MSRNYSLSSEGIYVPSIHVSHRHEDYDEAGFETLRDMQERHFWYRGRHRFLLDSVNSFLPSTDRKLSAIDLGGGAGGWLQFLGNNLPNRFAPLALADSSLVALKLAATVLPHHVKRYQIDLMQLHMHDQWDVAFLLDVIEHIPDDLKVLQQAHDCLKPGGYLFVTTPAFPKFWSYNDDMVHHQRRYCRSDFVRLALQSGLVLCDARYFMFYLSPLYLLSRIKPGFSKMTPAEKRAIILKQHKVPFAPINNLLSAIFALESPIGHRLNFPWGTSILGVFKKP